MNTPARRPRVPSDAHIKSILTRNFGANTRLIHALAKEVKSLRSVVGRRRKIPVLVVSKDDGQDEIYYDSRFASVMVVHKRDELDMATCPDPTVKKFNDLWWPCNLNQFTFYASGAPYGLMPNLDQIISSFNRTVCEERDELKRRIRKMENSDAKNN